MEKQRQKTIGPYVLNHTLGKGQTGVVRLGVHCTTKEKVAVKIIDRTKLSPHILAKVEREIAIMKLIEHPHVLRLYDVYENKTHLFLILEYVDGGELFDYLIKKGKLSNKEARRFFSQIISAIDFCHKHCVCHRDLKPENLLLDYKNNIKVADFGMASLQVGDNSLLETSCGSPHYACPEVVKGVKYDGRKADIWSCGVILYALVVGVLPFDDDNLRNLLEKVKKGVFRIPEIVHQDCQHLIKEMIKVDPTRRITMKQILKHNFLKSHVEIMEQLPVQKVVRTEIIARREAIDPDVLSCMNNLGCFHDKEKLVEKLLRDEENMEKVMYFLLLERKERRPASADVVPKALRQMTDVYFLDPPRKRVDSCDSPRLNRSSDSSSMDSSIGRPRAGTDISSMKNVTTNAPQKSSSTPPGSPWWSKLPGMRKTSYSPKQSPDLSARRKSFASNPSLETSPNEVKKSWFAYLPLGHSHAQCKDEPFFMIIKDKSLGTIKADLVHAFLTIPHLTHNVTSATTFTAEYGKHKGLPSTVIPRLRSLKTKLCENTLQCGYMKTLFSCCSVDGENEAFRKRWLQYGPKGTGTSVFRKSVRVDVNIVAPSGNGKPIEENTAFTINIKLVSGSSHKFRKLCEKVQEILLSNGRCSPKKSRRNTVGLDGSYVDGATEKEDEEEEEPYMSASFHCLTDTESEGELLSTPEDKNNGKPNQTRT